MSAPTKRKHKVLKTKQVKLATSMFKRKTYTSQWSEKDAETLFNMNKELRSVMRSGKDDLNPIEWIKQDDKVFKKEFSNA